MIKLNICIWEEATVGSIGIIHHILNKQEIKLLGWIAVYFILQWSMIFEYIAQQDALHFVNITWKD